MFFGIFFGKARMWEPRSWILGAALGLLAMDSVLAQEGWGTFGGPEVAARAVVLMNANTGEILFAKEPHLRLPPASTTKVLTALVAMEHLDPNARVQASAQAASTVPSRIGLHAGEMASTHDLLYGLMLKSGNDAAETLAEAAGGSVYGFASLMNSKAWSLGARNSHFMNPHGLPDEDHYSTAYDLALIFRHAMNYPMFTDIVRTRSAVLRIDSGQGPYNDSRLVPVMNHNRLLATYEGARGGKTGFTLKARRCFVGEVDRGGVRLIVSLLGSPSSGTLWQDAHTLLDYGFARYGLAPPAPVQPVTEPQPIMVRRTPVITPDAERLAMLQPELEEDEPEPLMGRTLSAAAPTSNRTWAAPTAMANRATSRRAPVPSSNSALLTRSQATSEEDELEPIKPKPALVAAATTPPPKPTAKAQAAAEKDELGPIKARPTVAATATSAPPPKPTPKAQAAAEDDELEPIKVRPALAAATPPPPKREVMAQSTAKEDEAELSSLRRPPATTNAPNSERIAMIRWSAEDDKPEPTKLQREPVATTPILDRPAIMRQASTEDDHAPSRTKLKARLASSKAAAPGKPASNPSKLAAGKPASPIKPAVSSSPASPIKLAAAPGRAIGSTKPIIATGKEKGPADSRSSTLKAPLAAGKTKANGAGTPALKDSKTAAPNKPVAPILVKSDKRAAAPKVIARVEPTSPKLPQKGVKRRI